MSDPFEGKWVLVGTTPWTNTYEVDLGDRIVRKTEYLGTQELLDEAQKDRSANLNKRWGDGQVIGRVPLPLYFASGLAQAQKEGDRRFVRRFWNDPDNRHLRTFEGNI